MTFELPSPDHDTITIPLLEGGTLAKPIVCLRHVISGTVYSLTGSHSRWTVGTSAGCQVRLDDPYVSASHCLLERLGGGRLAVTDLESKNGVFVDGLRVRSAELRAGAELRIGRTALTGLTDAALRSGCASDLLVGRSPVFRAAIDLALRVARSGANCSVLILGETGTGKELVAQLIHENSPRSDGPFVTLNCGSLTGSLIGSELFGHQRGAFTDAGGDRDGVFTQADGGTLFLDEVGELPGEQQPHLLRALESGEVRPLGAVESHRVDVQFVSATNRADIATRKRLRPDLYHRLATIIVRLPPLRDRATDIALLVNEFIRRDGGEPSRVSLETMRALRTYPWPGNVRELRHAVKRALTLTSGELTLASFLPEVASDDQEVVSDLAEAPKSVYDDGVKRVLAAALAQHGSVRRAARALGVPKSTFADRAKRHGLKLG